MNNKLKPAIIGGIVVGLLSAIPFVNIVNVCCCFWAILGGALATYMYIKASPNPVKAGDGAVLGLLAGVVGALIYIVIGIPLGIVMGKTMIGLISGFMESVDPRQAEMMRAQMAAQTIVTQILRGLFSAFLLLIFSTIGGLLGVPIFEKRKGGPDLPPPPQGFSGQPSPGGYGSNV